MFKVRTILLLVVLLLPALATCFVRPATRAPFAKSVCKMAPRFDEQEQKWYPTSPEEEASAGYDIWGSLLRQGPNPFIQRLFQPDEYDQGVLKFMAGDDVDRNTAQAEMDAYLQNPNDWAYNRVNGYNVDYLTLNTKQIALTLTWAAIIVPLLGRGVYCGVTGDSFWAILPH